MCVCVCVCVCTHTCVHGKAVGSSATGKVLALPLFQNYTSAVFRLHFICHNDVINPDYHYMSWNSSMSMALSKPMHDNFQMPSTGEISHQPLSFQSSKHMFGKKNVITQLLYSKRGIETSMLV